MEKTFDKSMRLLFLYDRLMQGDTLNKNKEAQRFGVAPKTIQRDMDDLRCFFAEQHSPQSVIYDAQEQGYHLENVQQRFSDGEILAVCKILLESRSMPKADMDRLLNKLLCCCVPEERKRMIGALISNERLHYIEPHHGVSVIDRLWALGQAVRAQQVLEIEYEKLKDHATVRRVIEPVGIMFSEYYFYLTAFIRNIDREKAFENADDLNPTIYRIDRIKNFRLPHRSDQEFPCNGRALYRALCRTI